MSKRRVRIIIAPPLGGKTEIKKQLDPYDVVCVGMSQLIIAEEERNPDFAKKSIALRKTGQFLDCPIILGLLNTFIENHDGSHLVIEGVPRTLFQAHAVAKHPFFQDNFSSRGVLDITVPDRILIERFAGRRSKEDREDDIPDIFNSRLATFNRHRLDVLTPFNKDTSGWFVKCVDGEKQDSAATAEYLVRTMDLRPRSHRELHAPAHPRRQAVN